MNKKYQIRKALGMYWVLDMEADGLNYKTPPCFNESGLYVWERAVEGKDAKEIAKDMNRDFGIDLEEAESDAKALMNAMLRNGML